MTLKKGGRGPLTHLTILPFSSFTAHPTKNLECKKSPKPVAHFYLKIVKIYFNCFSTQRKDDSALFVHSNGF